MQKLERYERIISAVNEKGAITVDELCVELEVSKATIRRDLVQLDEEKMLKRTHGGAMILSKPITADVPISFRQYMQRDEKERIALAALEYIKEGDTICIGAGTTACVLASKLDRFSRLTVLTNDLGVAVEVAKTENDLMVAGGQLKKSSNTLMGIFTEKMLGELHVDTAFMSVDAIDLQEGFMDYNTEEISMKRIMIRNARRRVMLCDTSKFNNAAFISICPISMVEVTISNIGLDEKVFRQFAEAGTLLKLV